MAKEGSDEFFISNLGPLFVLGCSFFSIFWGTVAGLLVRAIDMENYSGIEECIAQNQKSEEFYKNNPDERRQEDAETVMELLKKCGVTITDGAKSFLFKEYIYLAIWSALFAIVLGSTVDYLEMQDKTAPIHFPFTAASFLIGSFTSILAGYIGMRIAVYTNTRVTFQTASSVHNGFITAFRGGQVLGFVLVGVALLNLTLILIIFKLFWFD